MVVLGEVKVVILKPKLGGVHLGRNKKTLPVSDFFQLRPYMFAQEVYDNSKH